MAVKNGSGAGGDAGRLLGSIRGGLGWALVMYFERGVCGGAFEG